MKLQNMAIIFAIIVIPISLILGYYIRLQINTINLQTSYDEKLTDAVYDAIKAYQINTENNVYSIINSSQKRDVEAAVSTFMQSFATGLGVSGYGESYMKPYVPAILFTLYDGYYIYAPTYNEQNGKYEHLIKPYVTYTQHYQRSGIDVLISYTLDNYITVIGYIGGEYVNRSGYLVNSNYTLQPEILKEQLLFYDAATKTEIIKEYQYIYAGGEKRYYDPDSTDALGRKWFLYRRGEKAYITMTSDGKDVNAETYIKEATEFTAWVKENLKNITIRDLVLEEEIKQRNQNDIYGFGTSTKIFDSDNFEDEDSIFNIHKFDMIKISIKENLSSAIANYNAHSGALGTTYAFQMPILSNAEWEQITKNICMVAFVQGLPMGLKTYNSYAAINNTRNKNYTDQESLCFTSSLNNEYHRIDCPYLGETNIQGYRQIDYEQNVVEVTTEDDGRQAKHYYKHTNLPCYYCIVARNYEKQPIVGARLAALRQALGRERQMLHY